MVVLFWESYQDSTCPLKKLGCGRRNVSKEDKGCLSEVGYFRLGEAWVGRNVNFSGFDFDFVVFNYLL